MRLKSSESGAQWFSINVYDVVGYSLPSRMVAVAILGGKLFHRLMRAHSVGIAAWRFEPQKKEISFTFFFW